MRAVVATRRGPPDVLEVQERPEPTIGPADIAIAVEAAGVNLADLLARMGLYPDAPALPAVLGYEVAGTVAATGKAVSGLTLGDRVMAPTRFGGYAERVAVPASSVLRIPEGWGFEESAGVLVNFGLAWTSLVRYGSLRVGERVLIHAAAGGVGIAATRLAKRIGAEVYGTASSAKHAAIREQGVDVALDYPGSRSQLQLPPFDLVLDGLGGRSWRRSYSCLRAGGRLVCIGASSVMSGERRSALRVVGTLATMPRFSPLRQMQDSKAVIGINLLTLWDSFGSVDPWVRPLEELTADNTARPAVAAALPFTSAAAAHRLLSERRNVGKVVLVP